MIMIMNVKTKTHLAHVDESAHQILVRECVDGVLCLISGLIFHNSGMFVSPGRKQVKEEVTHPHPYFHPDKESFRQSNVQ